MTTFKRVHARRLLKLAFFLQTVPRERFDFSTWVGADWKGKSDLSCGTVACALGWATTIPEFRKLGLRLRRDRVDGFTYPALKGMRQEAFHYSSNLMTFRAAEVIFGLSDIECNTLFFPLPDGSDDRATAKQIARRIFNFVRRKALDAKKERVNRSSKR